MPAQVGGADLPPFASPNGAALSTGSLGNVSRSLYCSPSFAILLTDHLAKKTRRSVAID